MQLTMAPRIRQVVLMLLAATTVAVTSSTSGPLELEVYKYFINQTFLQRQFPCSKEEVECFKNLQLLHEADGKCYSVGEQGPCAEGEVFHADKHEASRKGGHIRGTCSSGCGDASRFPVGATGECLTREEVEAKICREDLYLTPALDAFGQWVCDWTESPCEVAGRGVPFKGQYDYMEYNGLCFPPDILRIWSSDERNVTVVDKETSNHPMLEFFTNTTYRDREYPCTEEEKACLQYGRILHSNGNCYVPGQSMALCDGQMYHLDWEEAKNGRLVGTCNSTCTGYQQPNVASGDCENYNTMMEVCRWEWGMQTQQNEFGQMACQCSWTPGLRRKRPTLPPPASGPGLCRVPDFSNPVRPPTYDMTLTVGFLVPCSEEEFACLREGRVLAGGACHALRTQGPCADGEELVLDKHALARARLQAVCKARPCPEGSVLMPIDAQCLTHQQVVARLCEGQKVALDEFGGWQCDFQGDFPANLSSVVRHDSDGSCELPDKYSVYPGNPIHPLYTPGNDSTNSSSEPDESVENNTV
ncbi:hypothetical protein R5R35_006492 [Gryllus longicercus]|uniref:Uncharacterized protein n=1 Tax=Gryllus longicercus TaxID=2509291 RepID=A0AAN9Z5C9_9ORTH